MYLGLERILARELCGKRGVEQINLQLIACSMCNRINLALSRAEEIANLGTSLREESFLRVLSI